MKSYCLQFPLALQLQERISPKKKSTKVQHPGPSDSNDNLSLLICRCLGRSVPINAFMLDTGSNASINNLTHNLPADRASIFSSVPSVCTEEQMDRLSESNSSIRAAKNQHHKQNQKERESTQKEGKKQDRVAECLSNGKLHEAPSVELVQDAVADLLAHLKGAPQGKSGRYKHAHIDFFTSEKLQGI
ncbi:hypothetical protein GYMLUDRAFT_64528 [Collybiopsis luxurians FD-317 M1]|uniref:Uncharacterized protein n=1 Tax=Collybiopsis luxurians FD-317 M1 TaxID=944289 RepID=A0A0D0CAP7_9AGAR|nr:hypothetical protein GYMLUDRAFT_64528 [Collybiopsis luxurians FD-317 M1]